MYKILVTGSREWTDYPCVYHTLASYAVRFGSASCLVIHGLARGADTLARDAATKLNMNQHGYPAEWDRFGKSAGVKRNQLMLDMNPDIQVCLAFNDDLQNSRGTADMVRRALKAKIKVVHVFHLSRYTWTDEEITELVVGRKPKVKENASGA